MRRALARGLTLIELMVALAVGMVMSLAVFAVMATFESQRRTTRSGADLDQTGGIAMFMLDQWIRSAGSGLAQATSTGTSAASYTYGCELFAARSGAQLLPMSSSLPAPFDNLVPGPAGSTGVFRLAPAVIIPEGTTPGASGQKSDVLVIMSAGGGRGQVPALFTASAGAATLNLASTVGMAASDLVLVADTQPASAGGVAGCMVSQVASTFTGSTAASPVLALPLDGTWHASTVDSRSMTDYSSTGAALDLGNPSGTAPSFQVVGVGNNDTLYSYDLLNLSGTALQARADQVFELHALYGVDTDDDGKVDSWVSAKSSGYTPAALLDGSSSAATALKNIKALRVGLILRTSQPERTQVSAASGVTLFSDPSLPGTVAFSRSLSDAERYYRYRTVEATIPLRNNAF